MGGKKGGAHLHAGAEEWGERRENGKKQASTSHGPWVPATLNLTLHSLAAA